MSKNFKIFLGLIYLLILVLFLYLIFSNLEFKRLNDFSYYKEVLLTLDRYISNNFFLNLVFFILFVIIWISLFGFATPLLPIGGILFGKWIGTIALNLSISIGALCLYIIANFFFSDLINLHLGKKYSKFVKKIQKNELFYYFILRVTGGGGIPFNFQNILPTLFNMNKINYFLATFFGFLPQAFIWSSIGAGLDNYIKRSNNFNFLELLSSPDIYFPIVIFFSFIIIAMLTKNFFK